MDDRQKLSLSKALRSQSVGLKVFGSLQSQPEADTGLTTSNRPRIDSSVVRKRSTYNAFGVAIAQFSHFYDWVRSLSISGAVV